MMLLSSKRSFGECDEKEVVAKASTASKASMKKSI